jgi:hypothetical protein
MLKIFNIWKKWINVMGANCPLPIWAIMLIKAYCLPVIYLVKKKAMTTK